MILNEGIHTVKVNYAEFFTNSKGNLAVKLSFGDSNGNGINWNGNFGTEKSRKYSLKVLATCGLKGAVEDIVSQGAGAFDGREVEITIEKKPGNEAGKFFHEVKWVNPVGHQASFTSGAARSQSPKMDPKQALSMIGSLGLSQDYKAMKAMSGVNSTNDIPF